MGLSFTGLPSFRRDIAPNWSKFSGMEYAYPFGSQAVSPACKGRTKMDDFVKDILLAITVTATAVLLSSLPLWLRQ
jgi:hypothetical protein